MFRVLRFFSCLFYHRLPCFCSVVRKSVSDSMESWHERNYSGKHNLDAPSFPKPSFRPSYLSTFLRPPPKVDLVESATQKNFATANREKGHDSEFSSLHCWTLLAIRLSLSLLEAVKKCNCSRDRRSQNPLGPTSTKTTNQGSQASLSRPDCLFTQSPDGKYMGGTPKY